MNTMSPTALGAGPGLRAMAGIEARRFARHPLFLLGAAATFVVTNLLVFNDRDQVPGDLLSWPVVPAFFTGLTSLIVAARLTRSTESSERSFWSESEPLRIFRNLTRTKPRRLPGVTCCSSRTRNRSTPTLTSMHFLRRVA